MSSILIQLHAAIARWACTVLVVSLLSASAVAQTGLPREVQVDILKQKITDAYKAKKHREVLSAIAEFRALPEDFPTPLLFVEATTAYQTKEYWRALAALRLFLNRTDRNATQYPLAVALYSDYEQQALGSLRRPNLTTKSDTDIAKILGDLRDWRATQSHDRDGCRSRRTEEHNVLGCVVTVVDTTEFSCRGPVIVRWTHRNEMDFRGAVASTKVTGKDILEIRVEVQLSAYEAQDLRVDLQEGGERTFQPKVNTTRVVTFSDESARLRAATLLAAVETFANRCK